MRHLAAVYLGLLSVTEGWTSESTASPPTLAESQLPLAKIRPPVAVKDSQRCALPSPRPCRRVVTLWRVLGRARTQCTPADPASTRRVQQRCRCLTPTAVRPATGRTQARVCPRNAGRPRAATAHALARVQQARGAVLAHTIMMMARRGRRSGRNDEGGPLALPPPRHGQASHGQRRGTRDDAVVVLQSASCRDADV